MGEFILFQMATKGPKPTVSSDSINAHPKPFLKHWEMYNKWKRTGDIINNILSILTMPSALFSLFGGSFIGCAYGPLAKLLYDELGMKDPVVFWDYAWCIVNWSYMNWLAFIGYFFYWQTFMHEYMHAGWMIFQNLA